MTNIEHIVANKNFITENDISALTWLVLTG